MNTLQSELYRTKLTTEVVEPKMESNFETLLINEVSKSEVANRCQMIRKGIKEKYKLYDTHQKNGEVKVLYKKGEQKMARHMNQEKYSFLRILVEYLIGNELKMKSMLDVMKDQPGGNENTIRNFLSSAKVCVPEFITNTCRGMWKIDPNISAEQFMSLYVDNMPKYWKKYQKPVKLIPKPVENPEPETETKSFQISASELLEFLKNNKIALDVSGAINVTVNVKFDISR